MDSGETVDFYLSITRNTKVTKYFLSKVLRSSHPATLNMDKDKAYIFSDSRTKERRRKYTGRPTSTS